MFSSVGGTRVYALQLISALMEVRPDWEFFLYTRDESQSRDLAQLWPSGKAHAVAVVGSPNTWRLQARLPARLSEDGIDVYHSLGYFLPMRWPGKRVVTIHDLNVYLSWRSWMRARKVLQWADMAVQIPIAARAADRIIAVSQFSKDSIRNVLHIDPARIVMIPNAPDPYFDELPSQVELDEAAEVARGSHFVLFVGILSPQKNLDMLIRAFAASGLHRDDYRLVLAGSDREGEGVNLRRIAHQAGVEDRLVMPGFVSNGILRALYHLALCVVLPSRGEGFGLPLVEAMACGAPVVAANAQALPEVIDGAGVLVDLEDVSGMARQLERISKDAAFRDELIRMGRQRRRAFSWRGAAESTAVVYEQVCRPSR